MNLAKLKDNKLLLYIILSTIFYTLSFASLPMTILCMIMVTFFIFTSNLEDGFCLFLYSISFSKSFYLFKIFYFYSFICVLYFVIKAFKLNYHDKWKTKSKKFKVIVSTCLIYLFVQPIITIFISFKGSNIADLATLFTFLLLFLFVYLISGKINVRKIVWVFSCGIIVSCMIAMIGFFSGYIDYSRIFMKEPDCYRFSGLTPHPNSLSRNCVLGLSLLLYLAYRSQKKIKYYSVMVVIGVLGAMTFSKAYALLVIVLFGYAFIYSFLTAKNKKVWWKGLLLLLTLMAVLLLVAMPYLETMLERFFIYGKDASWFNNITTGRVSIWGKFIDVLTSNPVYLIFGKSMMGILPVPTGAHLTYLALLYQYGLVGVTLFLIFIFMVFKNLKNHTGLSYLPLILILLSALSEDHIFIHIGYLYFGIALLALSSDKVKNVDRLKSCENSFFGEDLINYIYYQIYLFFKRFIDVCVSFVSLIILMVPMVIVGILVKVTSKGPVFFKDKRVGRYGKPIVVLKFRSMYDDAESKVEQLLTKEQYEMWKTERKVENDPRITKFGKFIRKTSIDELPQLINILKGDLSLVGNRPLSVIEHETHFTKEEQEQLNSKRPGLTGYWQVYGRSGVDFASGKRQEMYLHYAKKAGFWFDIKIFIMTFWVVITRKGAK